MSKYSGTQQFERSVTVPMPTEYGEFRMTVYTELENGREHIVLAMGELERQRALTLKVMSCQFTLVRTALRHCKQLVK